MPSDAERLVEHFNQAMPRMQAAWLRFKEKGRIARREGRPRYIHARSSHRSMYYAGWDEEDKRLRDEEPSDAE